MGSYGTDAIDDLGCVRLVDTTASTYSAATANSNSDTINAWFDGLPQGYPKFYSDYNCLTFNNGYVCLGKEIGQKVVHTFVAENSGGTLRLKYTSYPYSAGPPEVLSGQDLPSLTKINFSTSGTLPTGLNTTDDFWLIKVDADYCKVATSYDNAVAGIAISYTNAGSGSHNLFFRAIPTNFHVKSGGGWAVHQYSPYSWQNGNSAGIIWLGDKGSPVLRLCGYGNVIRLNIFREVFINQTGGTSIRGRCALLMHMGGGLGNITTGKHQIQLSASGFRSVIETVYVYAGHSDVSHFEHLESRNCESMYRSDNNQAIHHHFGRVAFFGPGDACQPKIFNIIRGGAIDVDRLCVNGYLGVTILDLGSGGNTYGGDNSGYVNIKDFHVDRAISQNVGLSTSVALSSVTNSGGSLLLNYSGDYFTPGGEMRPVQFTTSGTLPTGLSPNTYYWPHRTASGTAKVAPTYHDAVFGTNLIAYTNAGTGSHTMVIGNGYLRLLDESSGITSRVRMNGHIAHAEEDFRPANYMNYFGEPCVKVSANHSLTQNNGNAPGQYQDLVFDVGGLPDPDEVKWGARKKTTAINVVAPTSNVSTGDGKAYFVVPAEFDGFRLARVQADVIAAGTTGVTAIQIAKLRSGTTTDMLDSSAKLTIDSTHLSSTTSSTPYALNRSGTATDANTRERVWDGDRLRIDIDSVSSTPPQGLIVTLWFVP